MFIEEKLKRSEKDAEVPKEQIESINKFKENEEYLMNSKKYSSKSNVSESLGI